MQRRDITLSTPRLVLEPLMASHASPLFSYLREVHLYTFIPGGPPTSLDALEARYRRLESRRSPDGREGWLNWVARRQADSLPVGTFEATLRPNRTAMFAYTVFLPFQRQGYAWEGGESVVSHLIRDYDVESVIAEIDTRNVASIALVERLGFTRIAVTYGADSCKGHVSDEYRYEYRRETTARIALIY